MIYVLDKINHLHELPVRQNEISVKPTIPSD